MQINSSKSIGFVVGVFPAASETFIIEQIAELIDHGFDVSVVSFRRGSKEFTTEKFEKYKMADLVRYAEAPEKRFGRIAHGLRVVLRLLWISPSAIFRSLNFIRYGGKALSLKLLCQIDTFIGLNPGIWHCHFGKTAAKFVEISDVLKLRAPIITSFYGFDVSQIPKQKGSAYYDKLKERCHSYIVMSQNMKERVVRLGFQEDEVHVLPVGIRSGDYPYRDRTNHDGPVRLAMVARLVEKKGVDDLLRALAWCRQNSSLRILCDIVGDGPLKQSLLSQATESGIQDMIRWHGFMRQEDMIGVLERGHIYVQPSRTAANGDME